jgi:hypothetical protein
VGALDAASKPDQAPPGAITQEALARHLRGCVGKAIDELAPEPGVPRYNVLAIVESNTVARAVALEDERLADFVRNRAECAVTVDRLEAVVRADPAVYRVAGSSRPVAVRELAGELVSSVAGAYADQAGAGGAEPRMEELLRGEGAAAAALRERVGRDGEAGWPTARARVAEAQTKDYFPGLAADEPLSVEQVERGCDLMQPFPEKFAAVADALKSFDASWVKFDGESLIEETEIRVARIARERIELACGARDKQLALVREIETERLPGLAKDVAADRPFRAILKEWNDDLTRRWAAAGGAGPEAYPDLFPRALDVLNKTVRQLYDARRQEQEQVRQEVAQRAGAEASTDQSSASAQDLRKDEFQSKAKSEDDKDKDADADSAAKEPKKPEGMGAIEYLWKAEPDNVLVVRDTRWRRAQVVLMDGAKQVLASATFRPDHTDDAAQEIYALIEPALTRTLDERLADWSAQAAADGATGPHLKVFLLVQSSEIRHLTSLKLRHLAQEQVDRWSAANRPDQPPVSLLWIVGL